MVSSKSKIIIILVIILAIVMGSVLYIFYLQPSSSTKSIPLGYAAVSNSQFQILDGWIQDFTTGYESSAKLKFNGSTGNAVIRVIVDEYPDSVSYQQVLNGLTQKPQWHIVSQATEVKEGVSVQTITVARDGGGETVQYYFFQKNGKYYSVLIDIAGGGNAVQILSDGKYHLEETVNTIIRTIN